ncbi:acyl-CoA dehydrogenase family protein [Pseudonocardia spinosispora]|uniref:acyl-CoA dehydrogenase family protein n=1 Tax=Pseudonocardia spinosispora TaxID=103441 RepID=UPI00040C683D|nr:acyl-CoA dehydrogenase family protein [Pseudonocardia spinosispora]
MISFALTAEQEMLRDGLVKFLDKHYDLAVSRAAVKTGPGWQPEIWRALAEDLGILGAALPEHAGGTGGGPVEMMVIAEALGNALVVEPYIDTAVLGAGLLHRLGGPRADEVLARIVDGTAVTAVAAMEAGPGLDDITTTARRDGAGWVLDGAKPVVTTAPLATHLLVTARTGDGGVSLFLVDFDAAAPPAGMTVHPLRTVDDRIAADLVLRDVQLPADALLGGPGDALGTVERAVDDATAAVCAEAVGCLRRVLADTVSYTKQRTQFGQPISRFQVLQHRMVDMYLEVEQASAATHLAIHGLGAGDAERARAVSAAKVTVARAARIVGQGAVQLHGGMGMTEELAVGHYFKRLTVIEHELGTVSAHLARYAALTRPAEATTTAV